MQRREFLEKAVGAFLVFSVLGKVAEAAPKASPKVYGPVAYYTDGRELNPPNLRAWAVVRGFPRKPRWKRVLDKYSKMLLLK